jgi:hypothetical protein
MDLLHQNPPMNEALHTFQPMLNLYSPNLDSSNDNLHVKDSSAISPKLYLVPTSHGESYDPDFAPNPSPLAELPNIERWTLTYVVSILEILAGRRSIQQVARSTHRFTYNSLLRKIGHLKEVPKIRKIHRHQPIEGVVEVTVTLVFSERVRALAARFEGVDKKWLCTEVEIL